MKKIDYSPANKRVCSKCKHEKLIDEFKKDRRASQGRGWICIFCSRRIARDYYASRSHVKKREYQLQKKKAVLRNQLWICKYLISHPCVDCNETDIECLDFDHLESGKKDNNLCALVTGGYAVTTLLKEIAKCEVVCVKCHRKRTNRRGNHYRLRFIQNLLK